MWDRVAKDTLKATTIFVAPSSLENGCVPYESSLLWEILDYYPIISQKCAFCVSEANNIVPDSVGEGVHHTLSFGPLRKNGCFCSGQAVETDTAIETESGECFYLGFYRKIWLCCDSVFKELHLKGFWTLHFQKWP